MGKKVTTCEYGCEYSVTEYLPLVPHTWTEVENSRVAPTCGTDGSVKFSCTCGAERTDVLPATGNHTYAAVGTVNASCGAVGEISYVCSVCQDTFTAYLPCTGLHTHDAAGEYEILPDANELLDTYLYDCNVCGTKKIFAIMVDPSSIPDPDPDPDDPIIPSPVPSPVPSPIPQPNM
jgi:hypothetical protein